MERSSSTIRGVSMLRSHCSNSSSGVDTAGISSNSNSAKSQQSQDHGVPKMISPASTLMNIIGKMNMEGRQKLRSCEFHANWLCLPNEIILHESEVEGIISYLKNSANEMLPRDDSMKQLKTYGLAPMMCNNALAFMMILKRDFALADDCLTESNRLIDISLNESPPILHKDYLKGIFYMVKGLKILLESFTGSLGRLFDFEGFLVGAVEDFDELPLKSKVAVLASKHFFLKLINRRKGQIKYPDMNEIVYMDPEFFEWRLYQYLSARQYRCETLGFDNSPSELEIQAIQYAWNISPDNGYCMAYLAKCLVERLRNVSWKENDIVEFGLRIGQLYFSSEEQAVSCIKDLCMKVLNSNQLSVKLNLIVADILGTLLPFKHRDVFQARHCIFQAFRYGNSVSSKANHRMAIYLLKDAKSPSSNPKQCEQFFEKAFSLDNRNTDALLQLIQVHLHHPKECYHKIRLLFATHLSNFDFPKEFVQKLIFLKGCFYMMCGESEHAIVTWMSIYTDHGSRIDFSELRSHSYIFRIFQWPSDQLNLPSIISETNKFFTSIPPPTSAAGLNSEADQRTKSTLMEMINDQYQALNSDEFYKLMTAPTSQDLPVFPVHQQLPISSSESSPPLPSLSQGDDSDFFEISVFDPSVLE